VAATLSGCIDETKNMTISFVNGPVKMFWNWSRKQSRRFRRSPFRQWNVSVINKNLWQEHF